MNMLIKTLKAFLIALIIFVVGTLILAFIIKFTQFREEWAILGLVFVMTISTFTAALIEGRVIKKRGLITGLLASVLFMLMIIFLFNIILFNEMRVENLYALYIIPVLSGVVGGIIGANRQ